jgi:methylglutaconyl-CoA hydratase
MMEYLRIAENVGVLTVLLNRPEKRNAFFPPMIGELTKVFAKAGNDKNLRAVLLSAEKPSFCAGGDAEWMRSMAGFSEKQNIADAENLFDMYSAIRNCPVPVIGGVFGHCFGGGAGLVAVCDIVAAEQATQFSFSEVKLGLVPAVISPFVIERALPTKTMEWFVTGQVFTAEEAMLGGLIHFRGDAHECDVFIEENLKLILNSAPQAVRETKALLRSYSTVNWKKVRGQVTKLIAQRRVSEEGQRGLRAFLDKKNPRWSEPPNGRPAKI